MNRDNINLKLWILIILWLIDKIVMLVMFLLFR